MKSLAVMLFIFSGQLFAGPIYSSNCPVAREIQNPRGSSGYFMSADCKKAYVLPPARGKTTVVGQTAGNLDRCSEVRSLNIQLKKLNAEITKTIGTPQSEARIKELHELRKSTLEQYSDLARTQGAAVELSFSNGIAENLQAYQDLNNNVAVAFVPVALKDMKLAWNQVEKIDPEMRVAFNESISLPSLDDLGPGSFNGRLDLSLYGACPLRDPFTGTFPKQLKVRDLAGLITPNVTYHYEVGATYKYTAKYNMAGLASKIKKVSSSGGLFKTSSMAKLLEHNESSSWFTLEMECDDSRVCEQAKLETALSIKVRLIKEVMDNIAITTIGINMTPAPAPTPGNSGAQTAAQALHKCANIYCQAGAVVLDVAQSVFGGTNTTDSYIKTHDEWAKEQVTQSMPVSFTGTMGFGQ